MVVGDIDELCHASEVCSLGASESADSVLDVDGGPLDLSSSSVKNLAFSQDVVAGSDCFGSKTP